MNIQEIFDTKDVTEQFQEEDIRNNKLMAILAYFGVLVLIPVFVKKDSPFVKYHCNQGMILCIVEVIYGILVLIISKVTMLLFWKLYMLPSIITGLLSLVSLLFVAFAVLGIYNVVIGKAKELPYIGKFELYK